MMREGNLKEIDIRQIILHNFERKIKSLYVISYDSLYDAMHSPEYRKASLRNFDVIYDGFDVAVVELEYVSPKGSMMMRVAFRMHFQFEYAERRKYSWDLTKEYPSGNKFSVKPILGIDELSIEFPEFLDKKNLDMLYDNIPQGGGYVSNGVFIHHSISGAHVQGHRMEHSHKKLETRIVDYFKYMFEMIDQACYYQEHPESKPKIIPIEQSSYTEEDLDLLDEPW